MQIIKNKDEWFWHKKELELSYRKINPVHLHEPEKYPFKVWSRYENPDYGDWGFSHKFQYQQEVSCCECGHKTIVWPETEIE